MFLVLCLVLCLALSSCSNYWIRYEQKNPSSISGIIENLPNVSVTIELNEGYADVLTQESQDGSFCFANLYSSKGYYLNRFFLIVHGDSVPFAVLSRIKLGKNQHKFVKLEYKN